MHIYLIESTDKIPYEPTYTLSEAYRSKRNAKKECKKLSLEDDNYYYAVVKVRVK